MSVADKLNYLIGTKQSIKHSLKSFGMDITDTTKFRDYAKIIDTYSLLTKGAMFWLDGTIIDINGLKYFEDKSGNGRNFLITGYDFNSDWTKGFPYKSAATISAPIGDNALIASDVNNFIYASNGTPNQIPVFNIYSDVDYSHRLFCRHTGQIVDADGSEIYEPRITDIVLYSFTKSGAALDVVTAYFNITAADTTSKWVSKAGNDTTGNGSVITPYLTIYKAIESVTSGGTVYVASGEYIENHNNSNGYLAINKSVKIIATGKVNIKSVSTGQTIVPLSGGITNIQIDNSIIGNETQSTYTVYAISTPNMTINRSVVKNGSFLIRGENIKSLNLSFCYLSGAGSRIINAGANTNIILNTCVSPVTQSTIVQNNPGALTLTVINCKYNSLSFGYVSNLKATLIGNYAKTILAGKSSAVSDINDSLLIKKNKITSGISQGIFVQANFYTANILSNIISASIGGQALIEVKDNNFANVNYNFIYNLFGTSNCGIWMRDDNIIPKNIEVKNNVIRSNAGATPIQIGTDFALTPNANTFTGIVSGNNIIGVNSIDSHGIVVFNHKDVAIKYNRTNGYTFAAVVKSRGFDLINAPIAYNISENCSNGLSAKGGQNQRIVNNTIINPVSTGTYFAQNPESGGNATLNAIFKNNIIIDTGGVRTLEMVRLDGGQVVDCDYNIYYSKNNSIQFSINGGGTRINFMQWQALGYDTHSIVLTDEQFNGLFTDFTNGDYSLKAGSAAIGSGVALGAIYDDGLDATTDWGSDTQTPVVVTKQQGSNWDVGAYIH